MWTTEMNYFLFYFFIKKSAIDNKKSIHIQSIVFKEKKIQNPFQKYPAINDDFRKGPFPQNAKHYPFTISQCIPLLLGVISSFVYVHVQSTSTLGENWKSHNYALYLKGRNFLGNFG